MLCSFQGLTEIEYRSSTKHCSADGLSRLPPATTGNEQDQPVDPADAFHVSQFNMLPVKCQQVRKETQRDSTLVQVYEHVMKGWHENNETPTLDHFILEEMNSLFTKDVISGGAEWLFLQSCEAKYVYYNYKYYMKVMLVWSE